MNLLTAATAILDFIMRSTIPSAKDVTIHVTNAKVEIQSAQNVLQVHIARSIPISVRVTQATTTMAPVKSAKHAISFAINAQSPQPHATSAIHPPSESLLQTHVHANQVTLMMEISNVQVYLTNSYIFNNRMCAQL